MSHGGLNVVKVENNLNVEDDSSKENVGLVIESTQDTQQLHHHKQQQQQCNVQSSNHSSVHTGNAFACHVMLLCSWRICKYVLIVEKHIISRRH